MRITIIFSFLAFIFYYLDSFGQDFKEDMLRVNGAYNSEFDMSVNILYQIIENGKVIEELNGQSYRFKGSTKQVINSVTTLNTDQFSLTIDDARKRILLTKTISSGKLYDTESVIRNLTRLQDIAAKLEYREYEKGLVGYDIYTSKSQRLTYRLIFDKKTFLLHQIASFQEIDRSRNSSESDNLNQKIVIHFDQYQFNTNFSKEEFDLSLVFNIKDDEMSLKPDYTSYQLIDYYTNN